MANPIKAIKAVKKISKGKAKVQRRVNALSKEADSRTGGNISIIYEKGKIKDYYGNYSPIKTKPRSLGKRTKQMVPNSKKEIKIINKSLKQKGFAIIPNAKVAPRTAKVPVKKRGN